MFSSSFWLYPPLRSGHTLCIALRLSLRVYREFDVHQSIMVSPTPPSTGTERAFERGLTRIFAPGELFMMSHGAGNFMRASLLLLHIVCGGFEWLECPRGWGFENRNLQIPTFAPSVPALGGRDWSGRPLIGVAVEVRIHCYVGKPVNLALSSTINSFNMASIYTCTCTCRYFVDTCNCNFIACVHFLYLLASPCMNQTKHTEGI